MGHVTRDQNSTNRALHKTPYMCTKTCSFNPRGWVEPRLGNLARRSEPAAEVNLELRESEARFIPLVQNCPSTSPLSHFLFTHII